jgi:hypothetical protein
VGYLSAKVKVSIMFDSTLLLMNKLSNEQEMKVRHGDYTWFASFSWQKPYDELHLLERYKEFLPDDFLMFLNQIMNGCTLFYDKVNGQWGFKIYSIEEVVTKQKHWKQNYGHKWQNHFVAFAELCGEANVLLFDLNIPSDGKTNYAVREGNPYDKVENWPIVSRSFHEWLDQLITAQGAKFWE